MLPEARGNLCRYPRRAKIRIRQLLVGTLGLPGSMDRRSGGAHGHGVASRLCTQGDWPARGLLDQTPGPVRGATPVSYTHLRAHETRHDLVCRLLLEKKKKK